ncbi:MAG: KH domain-containing protein [Vicinamibacterales bacterium]
MSGPQTAADGASPLRVVIEVVVRALVDHPDAVSVTESVRRGVNVLELRTAPGDMGKIIGRQGRTAAALRTLLAATAERHGKRAQLDIRD